jgi:hypothetical protein
MAILACAALSAVAQRGTYVDAFRVGMTQLGHVQVRRSAEGRSHRSANLDSSSALRGLGCRTAGFTVAGPLPIGKRRSQRVPNCRTSPVCRRGSRVGWYPSLARRCFPRASVAHRELHRSQDRACREQRQNRYGGLERPDRESYAEVGSTATKPHARRSLRRRSAVPAR